jgi:hypothetical protein
MRFCSSQWLNPITNRVLLRKLSCGYPSSLRAVAYDPRIALKGPAIDPSDILRCQQLIEQSELGPPPQSFAGDYAELETP